MARSTTFNIASDSHIGDGAGAPFAHQASGLGMCFQPGHCRSQGNGQRRVLSVLINKRAMFKSQNRAH
jgi:hypothetical protein